MGVGFWSELYFRYNLCSPFSDVCRNAEAEINKALSQKEATELSLPLKGIVTLPRSLFNSPALPSLTSISLVDNHLTTIPIDLFDKCANLVNLDLSGNYIASISRDSFESLKKVRLRTLDLSRNGLRYLPWSLDPLVGIVTLKLSKNKLEQIGDLRILSDSLRVLDLSDNRLVELEGLGWLSHLEELDLHGNKLTELDGIGKLTTLTRLKVSSNQLVSIPARLRNLDLLELFDVNGHPLDENSKKELIAKF